uniref:non-specific serine/threonine protein kinase n=1 Tax=Leersia perrieri TaxID=77586 RepID=A0A0D9W9G9_9ORYZ
MGSVKGIHWAQGLQEENYFTGPLPAFIGELTSLNYITVGINALSGPIPKELGNPTNHLPPSQWTVVVVEQLSGSDNAMYQDDNTNLGAASYYVEGTHTWGVSTTGRFMDPPNGSCIIYSSRQFDNTLDSGLFQTARMSPSSLRYYGIGLENGNYTVTLQFAEGERKKQGEKFDIRKAAGGKSFTVVKKQYVVPVTKNFLEIHLFVVALETVVGESNYQNTLKEDRTYIFERVCEMYKSGRPLDFVDPNFSEFNSEEVIRVIRVSLLCTQGSPHQRPPMSKVVSMLTGDTDITEEATNPSYITEWQTKNSRLGAAAALAATKSPHRRRRNRPPVMFRRDRVQKMAAR